MTCDYWSDCYGRVTPRTSIESHRILRRKDNAYECSPGHSQDLTLQSSTLTSSCAMSGSLSGSSAAKPPSASICSKSKSPHSGRQHGPHNERSLVCSGMFRWPACSVRCCRTGRLACSPCCPNLGSYVAPLTGYRTGMAGIADDASRLASCCT